MNKYILAAFYILILPDGHKPRCFSFRGGKLKLVFITHSFL